MKPLPVCYCSKANEPHAHPPGWGLEPALLHRNEWVAELRRLRRYERAVVAWLKWRSAETEKRLATLAVASVKRAKAVRHG